MTAPAQQSSPEALKISGPMSVYTVDKLRDHLLEHMANHGSLIIDVAAVDACDCAGVQLLFAASKSALRAGYPFQLRRVSHALNEAAQNIGLDLFHTLNATPDTETQ